MEGKSGNDNVEMEYQHHDSTEEKLQKTRNILGKDTAMQERQCLSTCFYKQPSW